MALNDTFEKDLYELFKIRDVTRATQGSRVFTVVDLNEGFYHIEIDEDDKKKTAFEFNRRVYEWNSMVMGFKNYPQILQRVMDWIFEDLLGNGVEVYMDDVVIHAKTKREHDILVEKVLIRFEKHNMKLNINKIQYRRKEVKLLGVTPNGEDTHACEIKKNEALEYPIPETVTELRRFLGLTGWFRGFIKNYAELTYNLTDALKGAGKNYKWTENMEVEFLKIKDVLRDLKSLKIADYAKEFLLKTDASNIGMGGVLLQKNEQGEYVPVQWVSKKFSPTERRYGISEKEMYAIFWGVKKFEYELRGRRFKIQTGP
ncbi:Retrovirus-related Pol polyprotein from transposon [Nosema granulosis]|uniref:Retrovirus-related Pol polyprotein from transposon n=1 Tax=Nosema granulosis TaxID=83296 RepID=A0A9P6GX73_9MICR|nr:Retrovirus-related Pol polyprotein from transposon [Nosema granulosis]